MTFKSSVTETSWGLILREVVVFGYFTLRVFWKRGKSKCAGLSADSLYVTVTATATATGSYWCYSNGSFTIHISEQ